LKFSNTIPFIAAVMFCSEAEECQNKTYAHMLTPTNMVISASSDQKMNGVLSGDKILSFLRNLFEDQYKFMHFIMTFDSNHYRKTVFDFDFSNPTEKDYKMNLLHCLLALKSKDIKGQLTIDGIFPMAFTYLGGILDLNSIGIHYLQQVAQNSLIVSEEHQGVTLIFGSLFNHSCDPNTLYYPVDEKVAFVIHKPVKANEQLFISYE
jgi:SET domain